MGPKKKPGQRGARGAGPGQQPPRSMPPGSSDPGIDIVFGKDDNKPKPVKKPKGHRQRGAGTVMVDRGAVERDGVTVLSWQRLPSQLIQQHADRLQLKAPRYQTVQPTEPGMFRFQISIPDRKNSAKDLSFLPTVSFGTAAQAKEHAALLALLKLQEDQPLERKLPEPYKTTWLQNVAEAKGESQRPLARWEKAKKAREAKEQEATERKKAGAGSAGAAAGAATQGSADEGAVREDGSGTRKSAEGRTPVLLKADNEFASKFEARMAKEQKEKAAKDVKRKEEALARSNSDMKVMMSGRIRKLLEEALGLTEERERHREARTDGHALTLDDLEGLERAVFEHVQALGFPADDVLRAMVACSPPGTDSGVAQRADVLLEWLCLHLEEDELPEGFDPRGKMLDVIRPGQNLETGGETREEAREEGVCEERKGGGERDDEADCQSVSGSLGRRLLRYGFGHAEVASAIAATSTQADATTPSKLPGGSGDEDESRLDARVVAPLSILTRGLTGVSDENVVLEPMQSEEDAQEAVDEEVMSLEAIYGDDVKVSPHMPKGSYLLTFDFKTLASMDKRNAWLDIWILRAGGEGGYPAQAPLVALVRGDDECLSAGGALYVAQVALARRCASLVGNTAIYDLLVWAIDGIPAILASSPTDPGVREAVKLPMDRKAAPASTQGRGTRFEDAPRETSGTIDRGRGLDPARGVNKDHGSNDGWRAKRGVGAGEQHQRRLAPGVPPAERKRGRESVKTLKEFQGRRRQRQALPAAKARSEFLAMVRSSQVVLVSGETGCGKTTQIPQFLLEDWEDGTGPDEFCALVTQPRRIAAVGVAQRVADERCEQVGAGVGYQIRGENKVGPETRLVFCTTGLLLRRMQGDPLLEGLTHLIVDEVHERHLDADFLLALLIGILPKRPKLKVILMSATLDTKRFAAYFAGVAGGSSSSSKAFGRKSNKTPVLHIPGRTFPVRDLYLEDALAVTGHRPRFKHKRSSPSSLHAVGKEGEEADASGTRGAGLQGQRTWLVDNQDDDDDDDDDDGVEGDGVEGEELSAPGRECGAALGGIDMEFVDEDHLDYQLIVSLVLFAVSPEGERHLGLGALEGDGIDKDEEGRQTSESSRGRGPVGSVLVFMPGTGEIDRLCRELDHATEGSKALWVLPLHGSLPPQKQRAVFEPPPRGCRKIVVSTNIAETSITIPDVTIVVDSCRVKEMGYDVARQMPRLQQAWASQDSLTQRKGRAGRVRAGVSFKLIRRKTFAKLAVHGTPEIRRVPLDPLVLQVKALGVKEHPSEVLARALDPPDPIAVQNAVDTLTELKALGDGAELTPLGWHLAALPCPVQVGKMLVYGAVLGCLSRVLSIAAGLSCRSPFLTAGNNQGKRQVIDAAKKRMAEIGGGRSDHTLLAVAVAEWDVVGDGAGRGGRGSVMGWRATGVDRARRQFCAENGLSFERMRELVEVRGQLAQGLASIGFISRPQAALDPRASVNAQAGSWRAVKAAVCAGLYPRVMRVVRPMERFVDLIGIGAVPVRQKAKEFQFYTRAPAASAGTSVEAGASIAIESEKEVTGSDQQDKSLLSGEDEVDQEVFIHPGSINYTTNDWSCPWLVYHERVHTSEVFVRDCTEVSPYALLLFGGKVMVYAGSGRIAVDGWVRFEAIGRIAALVNKLRQRLDGMLWEKIQNPRLDIAGSKLSEALVELLQTDGMG